MFIYKMLVLDNDSTIQQFNNKVSASRGFTLLELIIAISIISITAVITIISLASLRSRTDLNGNAQNIISILNVARSKTTASEGPSQWGAHFETSLFALFKGATYNVSDSYTKIYNLPSSLELVNISLYGGGVNVVFDRITGQTQNYGSITLRKISEPTNLINITVEQFGQTSATTLNQPPSETRATDSRHMHFTYSGDARGATLKLYFPTGGPLTQDISIPSSGQLDWSGAVTVSGSNQVLVVRTHSLDASSAQFSITRDRRYNNAALEVWLNAISTGENLINYLGNGAESQGASAWVSAPVRQ